MRGNGTKGRFLLEIPEIRVGDTWNGTLHGTEMGRQPARRDMMCVSSLAASRRHQQRGGWGTLSLKAMELGRRGRRKKGWIDRALLLWGRFRLMNFLSSRNCSCECSSLGYTAAAVEAAQRVTYPSAASCALRYDHRIYSWAACFCKRFLRQHSVVSVNTQQQIRKHAPVDRASAASSSSTELVW